MNEVLAVTHGGRTSSRPESEVHVITAPLLAFDLGAELDAVTMRPEDGAAERSPSISDPVSTADRELLDLTGLVRLTSAADWLDVNPATLRRHVHDGRCSARKFGGHWFVGRGTIERWRVRRRMHLRG